MRHRRTDRQETFSPLQDKTLANVLRHLFVTEFGYENRVLFAEAMAERILEVINTFVKPASLLKPGQLLWIAVANDGRKHAGKSMKEIPQTLVILDLVNDDLQALADGQRFRAVRRQRIEIVREHHPAVLTRNPCLQIQLDCTVSNPPEGHLT